VRKNELVEEYEVGKPYSLWKSWTIKQKIVWFFMNKLNFGRKEINRYHSFMTLLNEVFNDQVERPEKKYWYEDSPKLVIAVDVYLKPIMPTKFVKIDAIIKK
jgi:hypothetical protein